MVGTSIGGVQILQNAFAIRLQFLRNEFKKVKGDTKHLYKLVAKLTGNLKMNNLPDHDSSDVISENLLTSF